MSYTTMCRLRFLAFLTVTRVGVRLRFTAAT